MILQCIAKGAHEGDHVIRNDLNIAAANESVLSMSNLIPALQKHDIDESLHLSEERR